MEEKLTIAEAARELHVSYGTMYKRVKNGLVPVSKDGFGNVLIEARHIRTILGWGNPFRVVMQACRKSRLNPLSLYDGR